MTNNTVFLVSVNATAVLEVVSSALLHNKEYTKGETPIIETQLEVPYTKKEMRGAMKKLKEKYWKSTGLDGVRSWMIDKAGDTFLNFLLEFYNKCWEQAEIPSDWYETLISYIYKNTGKLQELTSYRSIALIREPEKSLNYRNGHVVQWQHLLLMTSGLRVRSRRAALFPKQELDYPAIAPRKFPREPEKSLNFVLS
jgi:hypothetical protein